MSQGMKKEVQQMKGRPVFAGFSRNPLTPEQQVNIIDSTWVPEPKHHEARARILAKGYTDPVTHHDLLSASAPLFCTRSCIGVQLVSLRRKCQCMIATRSDLPHPATQQTDTECGSSTKLKPHKAQDHCQNSSRAK